MIQGVTGFMGNVGDIETMSGQAINILQFDERLNEFKKNAAQHAQAFDIHNIVPLYERLYDEVLSKELVH